MSLSNYDLHERLDRLSNVSAEQDVLVSLAVPPGDSIGEARQPVETDYAEATQLDEQSSPKPPVDALEAVRDRLDEYDEIPDNGLLVYAGAPDGNLLTATFDDPPVEIEESIYAHATEFDLSPLESVTEPSATYGLLVVERGGAALGRLDDEGVEEIDVFDSDVPDKSGAGGQSAERFERDREGQERKFFGDVAERATVTFVEDDEIDGLLLGGTTGTIERFREEAELDDRLEELIAGEFTVEYATTQGLEQLAERGQEAIDERDREEVSEALDRFFDDVGSGQVAYGNADVDDALEYEAVDTLLLSTTLEGAAIQKLGERAEEQGGEALVVPDDFPNGDRFADAFDGIGAILRFPIE
ncbi:peptide chain release factor 1 [Natronococcus amylolyticus DSM 10524]|uniref:Peptide chain release factor 1 n=1 Tax=Natronococcus amylolyticus DSM 10524 TaxID=1227497 RepID=L9X517_9EURY|nr:Vms1/Ankzf1 family peptidyl-tRNA hydrolase [Natronococcus amylolyticus]ELY56717.1 peptide chain release factor 1 [Natronococcus amylolyticus DSM 10524]